MWFGNGGSATWVSKVDLRVQKLVERGLEIAYPLGLLLGPTRTMLLHSTRAFAAGILSPRTAMAGTNLKRNPRFAWFWRMLSPVIAAYMFVNARLTAGTSLVTFHGPGADYSGAAVYVNWHKYVPFLCIHHGQHRRWLLMSSAPYLGGIALWCGWMGLTVVRGAPGERSRESLVHLIDALKRGNSVVLAGCIDLARSAGVPIIPVACRSRKGKANLKRWDQFYTIGVFDRIEVWYGTPIILDRSEPDAAALERVQKALETVS